MLLNLVTELRTGLFPTKLAIVLYKIEMNIPYSLCQISYSLCQISFTNSATENWLVRNHRNRTEFVGSCVAIFQRPNPQIYAISQVEMSKHFFQLHLHLQLNVLKQLLSWKNSPWDTNKQQMRFCGWMDINFGLMIFFTLHLMKGKCGVQQEYTGITPVF